MPKAAKEKDIGTILPARGVCPICGEHISLTGICKYGRLIGSCGDAFWAYQWIEDIDWENT